MRSQNAKNTPKLEPPKDEPYINGRDFIGPKHEWANEPDEVRNKIEEILKEYSDATDFVLEVADDAPLDDPDFFDRPTTDATQSILALIKLQQEALLIWVHDNRLKKSFHKELDAKLDKLRLEL